jgi:hypothetical protein
MKITIDAMEERGKKLRDEIKRLRQELKEWKEAYAVMKNLYLVFAKRNREQTDWRTK